MGVWLATKTLEAIDAGICLDSGNEFKRLQGNVLPHIGDAYKPEDDDYRSHLGASVIGAECARSVFYGYRWAYKPKPRGKKGEPALKAESRMRRLWNRGHLEEGRFIAMMLMIGAQVYQQDAEGKQYRMSALGGHFSGSGDGIAVGIPDLPEGVPCLTEYKTHSDDSFDKLKAQGVRLSKAQHYVQMQEYMHHFGLLYALYLAVNKNTEELYGEIVMYDRPTAEHFIDRAKSIVYAEEAPARIRGGNPGFHVCKYMCDHTAVCYHTIEPDRNCRTCQHAFAMPDGTWQCVLTTTTLDKPAQLAGCGSYTLAHMLK